MLAQIKAVYKRYFNQFFIAKPVATIVKTTLAFSLISG
ncbi:hypothetical protein SALWKB12_1062 [Snodgrassella communis]|uniref:Uncharacterized protein n=1 Tax=Snodgrassella communis TaxID=2946699 RepID=A0A836MRU9_9NEIS|nr:hypothetical protein SALWKB12_1062 [Snodgrassella communis]KDN15464.1 hypothetical protein SALWKB29_0568 [Snodgrassella communis]